MFESNLLGTRLDYWPFFETRVSRIVHQIRIDLDKDTEDRLYDEVIRKFGHLKYDWSGFFYFLWRALLLRVFKVPMPTRNAWGNPNQFLCVGLIKGLDTEGLPTWLRQAINNIPDCDMISPEALYRMILKAQAEANTKEPQ